MPTKFRKDKSLLWRVVENSEEMLFFLPSLAYASLCHIPYSTRCSDCGKRLPFSFSRYRTGLCEECEMHMWSYDRNRTMHWEKRWANEFPHSSFIPGDEILHHVLARKVGQGRMLEVGCGGGYLLSKLQSRGQELYGIDISKNAINIAKTRVKNGLCVGNARSLPFKSDSFDYLASIEILDHIESDDALWECYRVLKPGGIALLTQTNTKSRGGHRTGPYHPLSFKPLIMLLQQIGFEIISSRKFGLHIPFVTYLFGRLSGISGKRLPLFEPLNINVPESLATHFFIECRKPPKGEG